MTSGINSSSSNINASQSNVNNGTVDNSHVQTSTTTTTVSTENTLTAVDTTETADSTDTKQTDYQRSASKPALPQPSSNAGTVDEAVLAQLYNPHQMLEFLKSTDTTPGPITQQHQEELAKVQVDDPEIVALAKQLGISPGEAQEKLRISATVFFKRMIKDLPEDQQEKLNFARMNPDSAKGLSPELKTMLANINKTINQALISDLSSYGISSDWGGVQPDSTDYNADLTSEYDTEFEGKINEMVLGEQITAQQGTQLRTMHYIPGSFANDATLQGLFAKIDGSVVADLRSKYGADASWKPEADSATYSQIANGFFCQTFQNQLNSYQPPLTDSQKTEIMSLYANPSQTPSSPEIGKIAATIKTASISAAVAKYGLDPTWMPTVTSIINPNANDPNIQMATNAFNTANTMLEKFQAMVNGLPEGPLKTAYVAYLQAISTALNKLQDTLYSLSSTDSMTSKKMSRANMDAALADIKRAQAQAKEAQEKQADTKQLSLGPLNDINEWIGNVISLAVSCCIAFAASVVLSPAVGVVILAIAVAYFVDKANSASTGQPTIASQLAEELNSLLGDSAPALTGPIALFASGGNPMLALSMMGDARTIELTIKAAGGDEMAQQVGAAVINGIIQIGVMVALMMMSGGAEAPALIANITQTIAKVMNVSVSTVNKALFVVNLTFTLSMGALQATQQGMRCKWEMVQADIATILSSSDAASEQVKGLIKIIKKLIDKLLAAMSGYSDDINTISQQKSKLYSEASAITTDLQG